MNSREAFFTNAVAVSERRSSRRKWWAAAVAVILLPALAAVLLRPVELYFALDRALLWWAGYESRYVQIDGRTIHYYVGGEGLPLVLVHGLGGRAANWRALATGLVKDHRVYALDLPGFGDSDKPEDFDYSMAQLSDVLRGFLDSQKLSKTDIAGWSMGGWISLQFASKWPERVDRLILAASAGMRFEPTFDVHVLHPENREQLLEMVRVLSAPSPPGFVQRDLLRSMSKQNWIIKKALDSMLTGRDVMDGRLGTVAMPVLLVWGSNDLVTPMNIAESMRFEMAQAKLETIEGCGHLVPIACADRVLPAVERFLAR